MESIDRGLQNTKNIFDPKFFQSMFNWIILLVQRVLLLSSIIFNLQNFFFQIVLFAFFFFEKYEKGNTFFLKKNVRFLNFFLQNLFELNKYDSKSNVKKKKKFCSFYFLLCWRVFCSHKFMFFPKSCFFLWCPLDKFGVFKSSGTKEVF